MKSVKKKCGALLLAAVWLLWLLPTVSFAADMESVYIDGKTWDGNAENGVRWDPLTATLTLTDAQLSWNQILFTDANETLTVRVNGENTITSPYCGIDTNGNMVVEMAEGASLTIVSESTDYHSLSATNDLTIKGGKYNLQAGGSALYAGQNLTVEGGAEITAESAAAVAIYAVAGDVVLHDGSAVTVTSTPYAAIFAESGTVTVSGQGTHVNLTSALCVLNGVAGVTVNDGAEVIGSTTGNSVAVYTVNGDIAIESGASVTILETPDAALYAANGSITISGQNTRAELTPTYNAANAKNNITIDDGAEVIASVSDNAAAIYSSVGSLTVTGQGTTVHVTSQYCSLRGNQGVTFSDGAVVVAETERNTVVYADNGPITLDHADATLNCAENGGAALMAGIDSNIQPITIKNSTLNADTPGSSIYSYDDIEIADSVLTLHSANGNAINSQKDLTVTGKETVITATTCSPIIGNTVTIREANVVCEGESTAISARADLIIADGADVTAKSTDAKAGLYAVNGMIDLEGADTRVEAVSGKNIAIIANHGKVILNAGYVKAASAEGKAAIMARQTAEESPAEQPEPQIEIGEDYTAGGNIVATTVWQTDENGQYYADTVLVSEDTQLNDQGLLDEGYLPTNIVEITPKQPPVDKTGLDEAIKNANEKLSEKENYTDETVTALTDAVAKAQAVAEREDATQDEVNAAAKAIEDAITGLQYKAADYTAVDAALQKVPEDLSGYTAETAQAVKDAVKAVERNLLITEQARVDAMAKAIEDAVAALEKAESPAVLGDIDGNGHVDVTDALAILRMAVGLEEAVPNADMDGMNGVTVTDALTALRIAVGLA